MEKSGYVSIWFGNINDSIEEIEEYVDLTYDEDGDSVPSEFFNDFHIDSGETDEDTIEKEVYESTSSDISILLKGCSYEEVIIPRLKSIYLEKSYNAIILVYNFAYDRDIASANGFDFIAVTEYEDEVSSLY
ncbi:immunity 22 family protein [Gracilibacillus oryzae]|uniref:Immunity 22 family protein n=1 Tax=Gracilibacillus oryzae TaxID=1672701 RepID=A0A7C8GRZ0_9BACI|nr:immunity 22 family protein [Gracilibacillus oryzae]KAB8129172.1 immunity 22 family protein [Gracilibacillus oryzae]